MKKEIGFVAVGQAGGNVASLFEKKGYNVFYMNTSEEDLSTLQQSAHKYHIDGGEGCNKDRDKAKALLADSLDAVIKEITDKVKESMVYVVFASGGGTGSGIGPFLVDILQQETDKKVGAVTILPAESETIKSHVNAYECARELADIEDICGVFFLDNNSAVDKFTMNAVFVDMFDSFVSIPEQHKSIKGNIDRAEVKEVLQARGAILLSKLKKENSNTGKLIETFKNNIFAKVEPDKAIRYLAISHGAAGIDLASIQKEVGTYLDAFQTYNDNSTICCLSGLSYPFTRLIEIRDRVKANQKVIADNIKAVSVNRLDEDINFLSDLNVKAPAKKTSSRDALKKYMKK